MEYFIYSNVTDELFAFMTSFPLLTLKKVHELYTMNTEETHSRGLWRYLEFSVRLIGCLEF
jgi:hypothetical protein